jgi:hypothetical protein
VYVSMLLLFAGRRTYVWRGCVALEVGLDGAVLLVEERHVGHEVLDDVHVREWVDAGFLGGVCGDAACDRISTPAPVHVVYATHTNRPMC